MNWHPDGPLRQRFKTPNRTAFKSKKPVGLGDAVAAIAQPIAKAIDAVAGTSNEQCGGCKRRRERLNGLVPDVTKPWSKSEKQPLPKTPPPP